MLFTPKKSKFVKQQKGKAFNRLNKLTSSNQLQKGCVGLVSIDSGRISSKQLISLRQTLNKYVKKKGRVFINIFPQTPITNKSIKVRMGKGKGKVCYWIAKVKPGLVLCEIETNSLLTAEKALKLGQFRLPISTKIIFETNSYD